MRLTAAAGLVGTLVLLGCGGVDDGELEAEIAQLIKDNTGETVEVDCPEGKSSDKGSSFECTTTRGGAQQAVRVAFTDDGKFTLTRFEHR